MAFLSIVIILYRMKQLIAIIICAAFSFSSSAQESKTVSTVKEVKAQEPRIDNSYEMNNSQPMDYVVPKRYKANGDTLHLPTLNSYGQPERINYLPLCYCGFSSWQLHEGLNLSLGTSVFASFGHNAYHGAGFTQSLSAMYAMPLSSRLSLAVGGYVNNMYWAHDSFRDAGLTAVLGYKFDEHWEGYVYGQKSLMNKSMPYPLYDINNVGDRIGTAIKYNVNQNMFIQISIEKDWNRR